MFDECKPSKDDFLDWAVRKIKKKKPCKKKKKVVITSL